MAAWACLTAAVCAFTVRIATPVACLCQDGRPQPQAAARTQGACNVEGVKLDCKAVMKFTWPASAWPGCAEDLLQRECLHVFVQR